MKCFVGFLYLCCFSLLLNLWACGQLSYDSEKIDVHRNNDSYVLMDIDQLYQDGWSELPQADFWKKVMKLPPDSCIINIASTRQILETKAFEDWKKQTEEQKQAYKDSLRKINKLDSTAQIYVTSGKKEFYLFEEVYPTLSQGIEAFELYGVDPWYAQAILLIESPGQIKKSTAGAYGPFQLMPKVAQKLGLTVSDTLDERTNFERSAYASARLMKTICIPETKKILQNVKLQYNENDLWFRLLVLHVYHAGAKNVQAATSKIQIVNNGQDLIRKLWQTSASNFKNSSQNYSQIAIAAMLTLNDIIQQDCQNIYSCSLKEN